MKLSLIYTVFMIVILSSLGGNLYGQKYFRISGEMTIKSKSIQGDQNITIGKVFFDRNIKQIIYNISFPEAETWVTTDSLTYRIINDSVASQHFSGGMAEFSIFNLALNSYLPNFGLKNSSYHVETVERVGKMVVTTWAPPQNLKDKMGNILVSTEDKKLFGVIFLDKDGAVLKKQFFEDYINISGIAFPGKIVEIGYEFDKESYQITNFRKLELDDLENNTSYRYTLPDNPSLRPGKDGQ